MNLRTTPCRLVVAVLGLVTMHAAWADDIDMARSKKCMSCHALDQKLVGPAFKSVAAKYANLKDAEMRDTEARLARKIREGGSGVWGVVPMPANPDVDAAEAQRLAHWVLMQK